MRGIFDIKNTTYASLRKNVLVNLNQNAFIKKNLITKSHIKKGSIVIDTGISFDHGKMYGDVDFAPVARKAGALTPTPGGVGPITVALLLKNTITNAKKLSH